MTKRRGSSKANSKASKGAIVVKEPRPSDILFGRGGHINHNPSNQRYLKLVCQRKEEYRNCKKTDKADIAWDIIRQVRERDPSTRFLKKDYSANLWYVVDDAAVRKKISQCLRERDTPVCPKAKRGKQSEKTTGMPKLRVSVRVANTDREEPDEESQGKADSEDEAWLPSEAMVTRSVSRRVTRRQVAAREEQISTSLTLVEDMLVDSGEVVSDQKLNLPSGDDHGGPPQPNNVEVSYDDVPGATMPPPLPAPKPIRQEGSNRVWSDFLTRSFASFAPSIFDASNGAENAWEDLLDTPLLPDLAPEDDQSQSSGEAGQAMGLGSARTPKRPYTQSNPEASVDWMGGMSTSKRRKAKTIDIFPEVQHTPVDFVFSGFPGLKETV